MHFEVVRSQTTPRMQSEFGQFVVHVILPIFVGGIIYVLFRPTSLVMFGWFRAIGLEPVVVFLRQASEPAYSAVPRIIIFCVPAGLWLYSLTAWLRISWTGIYSFGAALWLIVALLMSVGSELAQAFGVVPGHFDLWDLVSYSTGFLFALALVRERSCRA